MAFHGAFTDALIAIGKYDLSGKSNECSLSLSVDALDSTVFGNTSRRKLPGIADGTLSAACVWDDVVETAINDLPRDASDNEGAFLFAPAKTNGGRAYIGSACTYQVERGGAIGDLYAASLSANFRNVSPNGFVSENGQTARTASGNGAGLQLGAVSATQSLYAVLIVPAAAGGTLDVVIESDDNGGFTTPVTRITFTQVTTSAIAYYASVAGAITDTFFRARWTIAGGGPSYNLIAGIGIR